MRPIHEGDSCGVCQRGSLVVGDHGDDRGSRVRSRAAPRRGDRHLVLRGRRLPALDRSPGIARGASASSTHAWSPRSTTARSLRRRSPPGRWLRREPEGCRPSRPASSLSDRSTVPVSRSQWSCSPSSVRTRIRRLGPRGSSTESVRPAGESRVSVTGGTRPTGGRSDSSTSPSTVGGGRAAAAERAMARLGRPSLRSAGAGEYRRRACGGPDQSRAFQPSSVTSHSPRRGARDLPRTSSKRRLASDRCERSIQAG